MSGGNLRLILSSVSKPNPLRPSYSIMSISERSLHLTRSGILQFRAFGATVYTSQNTGDNKPKHTADSYFKDVDTRPPADTKTHQVDANANNVQRPYEPPKGTHATTSKENPFEPSVESQQQKEERLRYGGLETNEKKGTSKPHEGPADQGAQGRKP